jgi:glycosyltransferase involved in cell wall biosynthesis/peptidoglycan/xylan/chitin deacetylase (PgdA/CDA1 family)
LITRTRKIVLVANSAWYLANFRLAIITALRDSGTDVVCACPDGPHVARLLTAGARHRDWPLERRGMKLTRELDAVRRLTAIYRDEAPDAVHHFTMKPILYGTTAAQRAGVPRVINSVTGMGHLFLSQSLQVRLLKPLVRRWLCWALSRPWVETVFQNPDDRETLEAWCPRLRHRTSLTGGSGVDLDRFQPPATRTTTDAPVILFAGRLLAEKGIHEFREAARQARSLGHDWRFVACGAPDPGNPSSIDDATWQQWYEEGLLELVGHVDPIDALLATASVVVLPSYREGTPRILLEAAAMGIPLVATDVPGCREVVRDGETGFLVPPRDAGAVLTACEKLVDDPELAATMGEQARRHVEHRFDEREVVNRLLGLYAHGGSSEQSVPGTFVLSLDLELAWGTRGRPAAQHAAAFLDGTRQAVAGLIDRLDAHGIRATWATVGALLLGSHSTRPPLLDTNELADVPTGSAATQPNWYAEDLIESILEATTPQELGCHTMTHPLVEPGPDGRATFRSELERSLEVFADWHLPRPTSFVYPKAQMAHFDVLCEMGFTAFRGPESGWFETLPGRLLSAGCRWLDARLRQPPAVRQPLYTADGLWLIPSSQFYSPFYSVGRHVGVADRVAKAIKGLHKAAEHGGVFHLWTHPFNLGQQTRQLLEGLEQVFSEARRLAERGRLRIRSMDQLVVDLNDSASPRRVSPTGVARSSAGAVSI